MIQFGFEHLDWCSWSNIPGAFHNPKGHSPEELTQAHQSTHTVRYSKGFAHEHNTIT